MKASEGQVGRGRRLVQRDETLQSSYGAGAGGPREREQSATASRNRDDVVHLHNGNDAFVPRVGPADFKAMSLLNSSQRLGVATLLLWEH